ncbi:hypothetical protein EC07798_0162, partial [Escherichia coli 07798]
MQGAT